MPCQIHRTQPQYLPLQAADWVNYVYSSYTNNHDINKKLCTTWLSENATLNCILNLLRLSIKAPSFNSVLMISGLLFIILNTVFWFLCFYFMKTSHVHNKLIGKLSFTSVSKVRKREHIVVTWDTREPFKFPMKHWITAALIMI